MIVGSDVGFTGTPGDLIKNLLIFARELKSSGLPVSLGRSLGTVRGLSLIHLDRKEEIYVLLRSHFVSRPEEIPVFDKAFEAFWQVRPELQGQTRRKRPQRPLYLPVQKEDAAEGRPVSKEHGLPAYSAEESLEKKDFGEITDRESDRVVEMIMDLARNLGERAGRRLKSSLKGNRLDLRATLRSSLRHGGEIMVLKYKRRRPKRNRFVILCDVSGSMDSYSRFLLQFIYGFQKYVPAVRTFVFSTRLTEVSGLLRAGQMNTAFRMISEKVLDWSGGTRIGAALAQYNSRFGPRYSGPDTVAIVLSDGWDQGELDLLERQMRILKGSVRRLMWLNPLIGMPEYRPIDRGMKTALPFADDFLDCHNLEKLEAFGRRLEDVVLQ